MTINTPHETQIPALRKLWQEAFDDTNEFLDSFFKTAFYQNRCRCILDNGTITAALYWFDCTFEGKPVAYIYGVSTKNAYRGQGLCRKLMEDTHRHLNALGYIGVLLVPGNNELFEMYTKMGYSSYCTIREFQCKSNMEELPLYRISALEYAELRKLLLPKGSILQENANLDFLQTQARFYMGLGFLLAAYGEKDTLHVIELLGDVTAAPAITHSLGYEKGIFRTVGNTKPFAMYHPLVSNHTIPKYFAFAFD